MRREVAKETLQELYNAGFIRGDHVPRATFESMLADIDRKNAPRVWSDDFDLNSPPPVNAGASICYECRHLYWVTPALDAYTTPQLGEKGKVCDPCLIRPITGRDRNDIYIMPSKISKN